jgi:hypothetical protein
MPDNMNTNDRRSYDLEIAQLKSEITGMKEEMKELRGDIKGLIEAWNTAKGMTSFIKWLSGIITASVGIYAFLKGAK